MRPYYIVPDGKVGHDAFAVIRETIRTMDKVAIARVVLTNRAHIIALEGSGRHVAALSGVAHAPSPRETHARGAVRRMENQAVTERAANASTADAMVVLRDKRQRARRERSRHPDIVEGADNRPGSL
jgi:hypothetical protein